MKNKTKHLILIKSILAAAVCLVTIFSGALSCFASTPARNMGALQTVKVAYFNMGDYYTQTADGDINSYDSAYLRRISNYTNLRFEYVNCGNWSNALKMLEQHQVDLIGTMQWSKQREEKYDMCTVKYGVTYASIACNSEEKYVYEDYDAMGQSTIGYITNYVKMAELKSLFKSKGISPKLVEFADDNSMALALDNGSIDMVAINSNLVRSNWKILEKYEYAPFYFATYKGNRSLCDKIDKAILKIELYDSAFEDKVTTEYFSNIMSEPFTKEELNYIDKNKKINVYFEPNAKPMSYFDSDTNSMKGILVDLCSIIKKNTGLNINCKPLYDNTVLKADDLTINVEYYDGIMTSKGNGSNVTDSLFDSNYALYHNRAYNYTIDDTEIHSVAVPNNRKAFEDYLKYEYPDYNIIECDNSLECLNLVKSGGADYAFLNSYIANDIITTKNMSIIEQIPTTTVNCSLSLTTGDGSDQSMLITIIDKSIRMIDDNELDKTVLNYVLNTVPEFSFSSFVQNYFVLFISIIAVLFIAGIAVISAAMRTTTLKKQQQLLTLANNELKDASMAKSDFLSRMSHDIRTPMNAIIGLTDIALDRTGNPAETTDCLKKIDSSSHFLLALINDVLNMSKIESKTIKLSSEPYERKELMRQINIMFRPQCDEKAIDFVVEYDEHLPECIMTDKTRFNQIIFNLLSNAIKYTPEGGTISLLMRTISNIDNKYNIEIIIKDDGIGISREFQKQMFEPFAQEKSKHIDETEGTGLGLAIVKSLVELMGGSVTVRSEQGQGTEFTLVMPLTSCAPPDRTSYIDTDSAEIYLRDKRILLCEDNAVNAQIAIRLLKKVGVEVDLAKNGKLGYEKFVNSKLLTYDAILMDIRMPIMDGLQATVAIRALDRDDAKTIPIIAMTANAFDEDRQKTMDAGMNSHLAKPIEPEMLYHTLAKFLS